MRDSVTALPWTVALRIQFRLLLEAKGRSMIAMAGLLALTLLLEPPALVEGEPAPFSLFLQAVIFPFFLAAFWGVEIWRGEEPDRRSYLHSLPVRRGSHEVARILAGACWMLLALAAWTVPLALFDAWSAVGGASLRRWIGGIEGPLFVYFGAAAVALWSRRPGSWIVLAPLVYIVTSTSLLLWLGQEHPAFRVFGWPLYSDQGLQVAVFGGIRSEAPSGGPVVAAWASATLIWGGMIAMAVRARVRILSPARQAPRGSPGGEEVA